MTRIIWLSHVLEACTPLYGGAGNLSLRPLRAMKSGDPCNTHHLSIPNHAGTHVDAPYHFYEEGKSVETYTPESWIFDHPEVLYVPATEGQAIGPENLPVSPDRVETDILMIRTGFERYRHSDIYWKNGPYLLPELSDYLAARYPHLRAVAIDFISISSVLHREAGLAAHKALLGRNLLIFEDISLKEIAEDERLAKVIILPLRFAGSDGAPCAAIGWILRKGVSSTITASTMALREET